MLSTCEVRMATTITSWITERQFLLAMGMESALGTEDQATFYYQHGKWIVQAIRRHTPGGAFEIEASGGRHHQNCLAANSGELTVRMGEVMEPVRTLDLQPELVVQRGHPDLLRLRGRLRRYTHEQTPRRRSAPIPREVEPEAAPPVPLRRAMRLV